MKTEVFGSGAEVIGIPENGAARHLCVVPFDPYFSSKSRKHRDTPEEKAAWEAFRAKSTIEQEIEVSGFNERLAGNERLTPLEWFIVKRFRFRKWRLTTGRQFLNTEQRRKHERFIGGFNTVPR